LTKAQSANDDELIKLARKRFGYDTIAQNNAPHSTRSSFASTKVKRPITRFEVLLMTIFQREIHGIQAEPYKLLGLFGSVTIKTLQN
jgi:hypothetical protein